jgi:hypothetical protein
MLVAPTQIFPFISSGGRISGSSNRKASLGVNENMMMTWRVTINGDAAAINLSEFCPICLNGTGLCHVCDDPDVAIVHAVKSRKTRE